MKIRNVLTVLGTAAVTAALTVALFAPWGDAQAGPIVKPVITQSQLQSQGCSFTLKTDKTIYDAGQKPAIEVTATNPTDKPVTATVWVTVTSTSPTAPLSRMLPMPTVLWSHEFAFTLPPDSNKSLTADGAALPAGGNVAMTLTDLQNAVLAGLIAVPQPGGANYQAANAVQNAVSSAAKPR